MTYEQLRSKANFSMVASGDEVKEVYRNFNIVENEQGLVSQDEVDQYIDASMKALSLDK